MESLPFYLSYAALWVLVVLHSVVLLGVVRIVYQLQQPGAVPDDGRLRSGEEAPAFSGVDLAGAAINSTDFAGRQKLLLFISPDCPGCSQILERDADYLKHKAQRNLIVICRDTRERCDRLAEQYELDVPIIADEDQRITQLYGVSTFPTAVTINADDRVLSYGHPHPEELVQMLEKAAQMEAQRVS